MSSGRTVGSDEFREALAPMMADIRVFTLEVDAVGPRHGSVPWEDSPAMRELADEPGYQERCSWTGPITDTHMLGGLTLQAAADYVRTFAESVTTESVPMYGHLVVARAALESSVVSWWLSEAAIARDQRVKRGLSEFLYSASEVFRLKIRAGGGEQVKEWTAHATELGWAATDYEGKPWKPRSRGTPRVDGVERPSIQKGITRLLVSNADATIGKLPWSKLSAVSHVTYFGLESAMSVEDAAPTLSPGVKTVPVGTNSTSVSQQAFCIVRALRRAAIARFALMGRTTRGQPPATSPRMLSSNSSRPIELGSPHRPMGRPSRRTHRHVRAQREVGRWRVASGLLVQLSPHTSRCLASGATGMGENSPSRRGGTDPSPS